MPVVSSNRYTSTAGSSLSPGSYYRGSSGTYVTSSIRSTLGDRTTEYRSRYSDVDGKRERKSSLVEYSRAPSATDSDSGISSRYRSDRSESRSRDISTTRSESGKASVSEPLPRPKRSLLNSSVLDMSTAEMYNRYSPAYYVPLTQRLAQAQNNSYGEIARSKSISNDIGRPPAPDSLRVSRKPRNSTAGTISERPESSKQRHREASPTLSCSIRGSMSNGITDNNGNELQSFSDIRKKFDPKMTVTKLPANASRYSSKSSVDYYLSQLKTCENGTSGYTRLPKDEKPVPVHLPSLEKNGSPSKWDVTSNSSRSNSDTSISKIISEPVSSAKPAVDNKLPADRLASIRSQLDPNNPIGKILEKSTVIQVENGDAEYSERKRYAKNNSDTLRNKDSLKNDIEKQVKTPKKTSNLASYIQTSQPIASGTSSPKFKLDMNGDTSDEFNKNDSQNDFQESQCKLKYIDCEMDSNRLGLESEVQSPSGTGFENKIFEHENYLMKRGHDEVACKVDDRMDRPQVVVNGDDDCKAMDTSNECTTSDPREDESSPETPTVRRKVLDKEYHDSKSELAGGRSGPSGLRRSSERSDISSEGRSERASSHSSGLNGLRNIGNTCFMNSVLQCLSNTRPLLEYVSEDKYHSEINTSLSGMKGALMKAFASLIKELWREGECDSVVNTTFFKSQVQRFAPRFMGYSQQDAQEFLRYLLEGLHEDVNRVTTKPKPILTEIDDSLSDSAKAAEAWSRYLRMEDSRVGDIFMGQLKSTLRCTHCHHDSVTFDPFWDLSLPIPSRTGNLKLQQCLQHFTKEEELDGDEKPTCSKCGVRRKCLKWFMVQKFPQVLVLHLKRFSPTERFRGKLSVVVEFPLSGLDMSPYAATRGQEATYNLYAVSNHSGTTYSGHYTAYCKHPYTSEWHEYNDSRVSTISSRNVISSEAYVLFYELSKASRT